MSSPEVSDWGLSDVEIMLLSEKVLSWADRAFAAFPPIRSGPPYSPEGPRALNRVGFLWCGSEPSRCNCAAPGREPAWLPGRRKFGGNNHRRSS